MKKKLCFAAGLAMLAIVLLAAGMLIGQSRVPAGEDPAPEESTAVITGEMISNRIEAVGELTSARMTYNGLIRYVDGKIPFLTQKAFLMTYRAEVEAGIELADIRVEVTDELVTITVPPVVIRPPQIDPGSILFYDDDFALFNRESKQDTLNAMAVAEEDVLANIPQETLKATARSQITLLLNGMFKDQLGGCTLAIEHS